jgi:cytochrome c oxidase subunit 3
MATALHEPVGIDTANYGRNGAGRTIGPTEGGLRTLREHAFDPAKTGIWVAFAAITMSFAALTSALVVRQGTALDWHHTPLPAVLCFSTLVLLVSSLTLEVARRRIAAYARGLETHLAKPMQWLAITLFLGLLFVAGQYAAWLRLKSEGLYLATSPSSSFFYVFTGVHAVHVLGGLCGLIYVISKLKRSVLRRSTFAATAQYWHFMGILWVYLLFLLWTKL